MEPDSDPKEPKGVPAVKNGDISPKALEIPAKLENSTPNKELEYLKTIEKLKRELAEKDKQLRNKDLKISLLTSENEKLKAINWEKDRKLKDLQEKIRQLTAENNSLIQNSTNLKNAAKNTGKIKEKQQLEIIPRNKTFLLNNLLEIKKLQNGSLIAKEKDGTELIAEIQI